MSIDKQRDISGMIIVRCCNMNPHLSWKNLRTWQSRDRQFREGKIKSAPGNQDLDSTAIFYVTE